MHEQYTHEQYTVPVDTREITLHLGSGTCGGMQGKPLQSALPLRVYVCICSKAPERRTREGVAVMRLVMAILPLECTIL